ncbi:transposase [Clostridium sp. CM028]|uniref:transposase n=1 Tax=unclassified Clostridium TaxID=2614128 RepID=UPI001C0B8C47|nr:MULTISPECIES: transposase [unclassified Clostridium]MBU3092623.1 transposase [Clostridium sp. CF011]MBW9145335.1 transposase [Clostridium sp. CM027]MBW9148850.1 transposase [Clostridium sp. CM028]UVE42474.1 transposase [Clostridium sp. CM027]WAG71493.1 transposase [Clostridium sp. CF011]
MPRKAREKTDDSIFHIMCKSISEINLFKDDEDKNKYLSLVKKYKYLYNFKIYGYCLMDNHSHLMIDANGTDISKAMHGINFSYAMYFNKKYKREGHLFKDRFKSKIVNNERYLKTLSLYIHNNPTDIDEYKNCPEKYAFSSLAIFLGKRHDSFKLVDYGFIMSSFGNNLKNARKNYYNLVFRCNGEKLKQEIEFKDEKSEYKCERKILVRNFKPEDIIEYIASKMNVSKTHLYMKYSRKLVRAKALTVVLMRSLCNFKSSDISSTLGNITQARVSKLSTIGIELIGTEDKYENIIMDFIKRYA